MSQIMTDDLLFAECIDALGNKVIILSKNESDAIWAVFKSKIPIIKGGSRIDWNKINKKVIISAPDQIVINLEQLLSHPIEQTIYVLWNDLSLPIIKTDLDSVLKYFDDVTCVGFETWFFNPSEGYIVEFYYLGELNAGLVSNK